MGLVSKLALKGYVLSALAAVAMAGVHERLAAVPHTWSFVAEANDVDMLTLSIGLRQQNLDKIESTLLSVSTPGSAQYGKHLSREEVNTLFKPSKESKDAVVAWLKKSGIIKIDSSDGEWVKFAASVSKANELLGANFSVFESEGVSKVRTLQYSVPDNLKQHVDLIHPTTYFGKTAALAPVLHFPPQQLEERQAASCSSTITPSCLKQIYNITYTPSATSGSKLGFGSFLNQTARTADLTAFLKKYNIANQGFTNVLINGGKDNQATGSDHGEADLDVEYLIGIGAPLPVTQYITGGSPPFIPNIDEPTINQNEPYLDYYDYLLKLDNSQLPQVISNSYGEPEETVPLNYATRVCNQIAQMGMRGISVIESSGDTGVGAGCRTNDGNNAVRFSPIFPATCPYITSIGGTQSISPEVAWSASSGGFSDYFARPSFQDTAVNTYLTSHISAATKSYYTPYANFSGRGFPDVAAHSLTPNYAVVVNGATSASGGTSAAAPVVAAIVGLLNDARLKAGKSALGYLNPWIYGAGASGWTDITAGKAVGCNGVNGQTGASVPNGGIVKYASWNGTVGWDPATGLGVPNFGKLLPLALAV